MKKRTNITQCIVVRLGLGLELDGDKTRDRIEDKKPLKKRWKMLQRRIGRP